MGLCFPMSNNARSRVECDGNLHFKSLADRGASRNDESLSRTSMFARVYEHYRRFRDRHLHNIEENMRDVQHTTFATANCDG